MDPSPDPDPLFFYPDPDPKGVKIKEDYLYKKNFNLSFQNDLKNQKTQFIAT